MPGHLQLVNDHTHIGGQRLSAEALGKAIGRPGDRAEPIRFARTKELEGLAVDSARAGVPVELAISLLAQRRLVIDTLEELIPSGLQRLLDQAAADQRTGIPLNGAAAGYLRDLQRYKSIDVPELSTPLIVPLPLRVVDRLLSADRYRDVTSAFLGQARRWEIASVTQGQVMTEWAATAVAQALAREIYKPSARRKSPG